MGSVVTVACQVSCGHVVLPKLGLVATNGTPKLTVAGSPALLETGVDGQLISTCGLVANSGPPATILCTAVGKIAGTLATKLFVGGAPVVITPLSGTTNGTVAGTTPQLLLKALGSQNLLTTV